MTPIANDDQRVDFRVSVDMLLNKYVGGRPFLARASNLSRRGLLLHKLFEPQNGESTVGLQFMLPGTDRVITCAGRIVHDQDTAAAGIEFTHVEPDHQRLIDDYILENIDWP